MVPPRRFELPRVESSYGRLAKRSRFHQNASEVLISVRPMDRISPAARSSNMRAIRDKGTKPEMAVRRVAHRLGYRYRLHRKDLPGRPDLVFPSRRKVVFVHGCFWHQHSQGNCKIARRPRSRLEYWLPKLKRNVERDAKHLDKLRAMGWAALTIWECEVPCRTHVERRLRSFLGA